MTAVGLATTTTATNRHSWRGGTFQRRSIQRRILAKTKPYRLSSGHSTLLQPGKRRQGGADARQAGRYRGVRENCTRCSSMSDIVSAPMVQAAMSWAKEYPLALVSSLACWFVENSHVIGATTSASTKLLILIGAVSWMVSTGRLPSNTATVLSKIGFNLIIPCMLLSKVSLTLFQDASWAMACIPLAALLQVAAGAIYGWVAGVFVCGEYSQDLEILGYHPNSPSPSAAAIAASTAAAMSLPQVAPQLVPKKRESPRGTKELVQLSCAFGNTLTLPLVFILALLPSAAADSAVAFIALFLVGWSPCLWSVGYEIVGRACPKPEGEASSRDDDTVFIMQTPAGATAPFYASAADTTIDVTEETGQTADKLPKNKPSILDICMEYAKRFVNPPLIGVFAGLAIGLSPLGPLVLPQHASAQAAAVASFPFEVRMMVEIGRAAMDVIVMLGSATLAVQAIVLAASMRGPTSYPKPFPDLTPKAYGGVELKKKSTRPGWLRLLFPSEPLEQRVLFSVGFVRMILMPLTGIALLKVLLWLGALPPDPLCHFVILLQSAMPPAQNLVLLMQLREETEAMAADMALLLLRLYTLSVLPVTLWVTYFVALSGLGSTLLM